MKTIFAILALFCFGSASGQNHADSCRLYDKPVRYIWHTNKRNVNRVFDCEGTRMRVVIRKGVANLTALQDFGPTTFKLVIVTKLTIYVLDVENTLLRKTCTYETIK